MGSEQFVVRMRSKVRRRAESPDEPSLRALRWLDRPEPEDVEAAVMRVFSRVGKARQRRLLMYALRAHSRLRPSEIAQRCGRSRSAVTLAVRDLDAEAKENRELKAGLARLAREIGGKTKS